MPESTQTPKQRCFRLHVSTVGHEIYDVEANNKTEARLLWQEGNLFKPTVSEVITAEIERIEEVHND